MRKFKCSIKEIILIFYGNSYNVKDRKAKIDINKSGLVDWKKGGITKGDKNFLVLTTWTFKQKDRLLGVRGALGQVFSKKENFNHLTSFIIRNNYTHQQTD